MPGAQRVGTNLTQVTGPEGEEDDDPNRLPTFVKVWFSACAETACTETASSKLHIDYLTIQENARLSLICITLPAK